MKTFTKEYMKANCGCYTQKELAHCSFMKYSTITLEAILYSEIPLKDKYWFFCKKVATKEQNQKIAIELAEIVLPLYEEKHPNNKAPREAIEAAKLYLAGHISLEELLIVKCAAINAYDAAYTYAAATAAAATYDAYAAAAAAYVAIAADDAIADTYAADADTAKNNQIYKQKMEEYLLHYK